MRRNPFRQQGREINDGPAMAGFKGDRFKLRQARPDSPFFNGRINSKPDSLLA